jgi:hypothetical protein
MGSPNGSIDTTHTPPPLSFYNTFNIGTLQYRIGSRLRTARCFRLKNRYNHDGSHMEHLQLFFFNLRLGLLFRDGLLSWIIH